MNIADLRALAGVGSIPLLDRVADGTWRGTCPMQTRTRHQKGTWSGDFEIQNTRLDVDGLADPVRVQSAAVSAKDQTVAVTRIRAKVGDIAFGGEYRWGSQVDAEDDSEKAGRRASACK